MNENQLTLVIDNQQISFISGQTILEVAEKENIYIPKLCYLKELEPFGACRLCLVDVEDMNGYVPACTTPAKDGMVIDTKTEELQDLRREILKLILSEHPYACLICENREQCEETRSDKLKAGTMFGCFSCAKMEECELRQLVDYLELEQIDFPLEYKNYPIEDEDPFFERDYNLCILCGRCVRICNELRGVGAINFINRGHETRVSTALDLLHIDSNCQFCGACVDVCPTGALTPKNTKWVNKNSKVMESVCSFCSVACDFNYYYEKDMLLESIPKKENNTNLGQACVLGRFCTPQVVNSQERLTYPMIRKNKALIPSDWDEVFHFLKKKLGEFKDSETGFFASPYMTNESAFLLDKIITQLNIKNVALHCNLEFIKAYRNVIEKNPTPFQRYNFKDIISSEIIFIINTNLQETHPVLQVHLKQAKDNGATVIALNLSSFTQSIEIRRLLNKEYRLSSHDLIAFLVSLNLRLLNKPNLQFDNLNNKESLKIFRDSANKFVLNESLKDEVTELANIVQNLKDNAKITFLVGHYQDASYDFFENILGSILNLSQLHSQLGFIPLWRETNLEGVYRILSKGRDLLDQTVFYNRIKNNKVKNLYTFEQLRQGDLVSELDFLIVQDCFMSETIKDADIVIPSKIFTEDEGTILNSENRLKSLKSVQNLESKSKNDWEILENVRQRLFESALNDPYQKSQEILHDLLENDSTFTVEITSNEISSQDKEPMRFFVHKNISLPQSDSDNFTCLTTLEKFRYRGRKIAADVSDFRRMINYRAEKTTQKIQKEKDIFKEEIDSPYEIEANYEIVPNFYKLTIHSPLIAKKAKPGNFIIIMTTEKSERIPLTLSDWDEEEGTITVYYQEAGFSTKELKRKQKGQRLYSVVGPLGKSIKIDAYGTIILGGGCYGIGGIYPIAKALKSKENKVIILLESKNELLFYLQEEFKDFADHIYYCTSDGSKGIKGKIKEGLNVIFQDYDKIDRCYFIGCKQMMRDASEFTKNHGNVPTFVSLNTIMIDGTGMCGGCRLSLVKEGKILTKFACVDGPTFNGHLVKWDELIKRTNQFSQPEKIVYQNHTCKALEKFKLGDFDE